MTGPIHRSQKSFCYSIHGHSPDPLNFFPNPLLAKETLAFITQKSDAEQKRRKKLPKKIQERDENTDNPELSNFLVDLVELFPEILELELTWN